MLNKNYMLSLNALEIALKALQFYHDAANWQADGHFQIDADTVPVRRDRGRKASKALLEITAILEEINK